MWTCLVSHRLVLINDELQKQKDFLERKHATNKLEENKRKKKEKEKNRRKKGRNILQTRVLKLIFCQHLTLFRHENKQFNHFFFISFAALVSERIARETEMSKGIRNET